MVPSAINVKKNSLTLQLSYADGSYELPFEFLRVLSPSAEVKGHGGLGGKLPFGKKDVRILRIEPSGNYALKIVFDDGHDSGLYDWEYLRHMCLHQEELWADYLERLAAEGKTRESPVINFKAL